MENCPLLQNNPSNSNPTESTLPIIQPPSHPSPSISPSTSNNNKIIMDMFTYIKIGIIVGLIVFLACNTIFTFALPHNAPECLNDSIFNATKSLNDYFINNTTARAILLIISSLLIDISFLSVFIYWMLLSRSWRFLFAILAFYATRAIVQTTFQLGFPVGYNWVSPNFPSLVVSYDRTNDFFYSGHVGMPLIAALEMNKNGKNIAAGMLLFVCLFELFTLIATRGHYSIDIFAGLICAHYFFNLIDKYIHYVDNSIIGMKKPSEIPNGSDIENDITADNSIDDDYKKNADDEDDEAGFQKVQIVDEAMNNTL